MSTPSDFFGPDDEASHDRPASEQHEAPATHARVPWPTDPSPQQASSRDEPDHRDDETSVLDLSSLDPAAREAIEHARAQYDPAQGQQGHRDPAQGPRHGGAPQQYAAPQPPPGPPPAGPPHPGPPHPGNPQRPQFSWPQAPARNPGRPQPAGDRRDPHQGIDDDGRTTDLQRPPGAPGFRQQPSPSQGFDNFFTDTSTHEGAPQNPWAPAPSPASAAPTDDLATHSARAGFGARAGAGVTERVTTTRRRPAATGWRRLVSRMTFGRLTPGPSAKQEAYEELIRRIKAPLADTYVVAFVNAKGGVGKTTMTVGTGCAIARERGDRVIAVDVDTDLGNLSSRFEQKGGPKANIEALASLKDPSSYPTVRTYTVQNDDDLEMLAAQNDPRVSYTLNSQDFETTMKILRLHYNIVLLDCGTAITSPLFSTIAKHLDALVIVASQDPPGLNGAWSTLTWLHSHGFSALLPRTVVTVNAPFRGKALVDLDEADNIFREQVPDVRVIRVPYDVHLAEGGDVSFDELKSRTRKALKELAGAVAEQYPVRGSQPRSSQGTGGF
jgi:MinD-like ATPase involved in chromosome partitioning or flagellar assembly